MPDIAATLSAQLQSHRPHVHRRDAMLCVLLLATLMMPSNYRAGTDTSHSHSVFQTMIDAVVGQPHHHDDEPAGATASSVAPSPFAPAALPLANATQSAPTSEEPDVASTLASAPAPVSPFTAMQLLGLLVAGMVTMSTYQRHWPQRLRPAALTPSIEIPPPRAA